MTGWDGQQLKLENILASIMTLCVGDLTKPEYHVAQEERAPVYDSHDDLREGHHERSL